MNCSDIVAQMLDKIRTRGGKGKCDSKLTAPFNEVLHNIDRIGNSCVNLVEVAAPIYDEKIRERILYIFDTIMKDDEKGKEQNAQGLYENRVINEIPVNSQEIFYQDAYDRCVKEI